MIRLYGELLDDAKKRREQGIKKGSFMDQVLDDQEGGKLTLNRRQLAFLGGVLIEGGTDTSAAVLTTFLQAMTKYQDVQKQAQKEIDDVVGEERSPLWSDFPQLNCVNMIIKEVMRWRPAAPLGFPHCLNKGILPIFYFLDKTFAPSPSSIQ
jgi:cytochrome P450 family 619